jgi:DNA polymerase-4
MERPAVAHLDVDAFYVAVECLRRPELARRPVVIAGSSPRAVVTTASYAARRYGIHSAMPAAHARRLCPQAVFIEPDFPAYRAASAQLMAVVRAHVERVEVVGLDEAYLDLSALAFPRAAMRRLLAALRARTGLVCSVGIAPNKLLAKIASTECKPAGFLVLSRAAASERFAARSPGMIPGVGPKTTARLAELGIGTIAQLRAASVGELQRHFGARLGAWLHEAAAFRDERPIEPIRAVRSESRERTFEQDIRDPERLRVELACICEQLCERLGAHRRRGRTVAVKVRFGDFRTITRSRTLRQATDDPDQIAAVAAQLLADQLGRAPVRLLGVRVENLEQRDRREGAGSRGGRARPWQPPLPLGV